MVGVLEVTVTYHDAVAQGSDEWMAMRCGLLTASEMKHIITPTLKAANNEKSRSHVYELAAQRISRYVEPSYISDDMLRGMEDEFFARRIYSENVAPVRECGFITRDFGTFTIGYSPDGLVGDDGLIEIKGRRQKFQVQTIADNAIPTEHSIQAQTGLLVTGRQWLDFLSYSGGLPMMPVRVFPDEAVQTAIQEAAERFEDAVADVLASYNHNLREHRSFPTERRVQEEML